MVTRSPMTIALVGINQQATPTRIKIKLVGNRLKSSQHGTSS